jgi:hypothetical protein
LSIPLYLRRIDKEVAVLVAVLSVIAFLSSCAGAPKTITSQDEVQLLRSRVKGYWEARTRRDWDMVESFVYPDARKETAAYLESLRKSDYQSEMTFNEIKGIDIRGGKADVTVDYSIKWLIPVLAGAPPMERESREKWCKKDGLWYVVIKRPDVSDIFEKHGPSPRRR